MLFDGVLSFLKTTDAEEYSLVYDQVVSVELVSTIIVSHYMNKEGIENHWIDARNCIKTDAYFRDANLNWVEVKLPFKLQSKEKYFCFAGLYRLLIQWINYYSGKGGSDYSAAIFVCFGCDPVTIWKDVPGILNGDPKKFNDTVLLYKSPTVKP